MSDATDTTVQARIETRGRLDLKRDSGSLVVHSTGKSRSYNPLLEVSIRGPGGEARAHVFRRDLEAAIEAASQGGNG